MENEQATNCGKFRAITKVPLPYDDLSEMELEESAHDSSFSAGMVMEDADDYITE